MMKSRGILRLTDSLGHILLPEDIRRELGIHENDLVEFLLQGDQIILKKCDSSIPCTKSADVS